MGSSDDIISRGQDILERYKINKLKLILKNKLKYSAKIDEYIPKNWNFQTDPLHDFAISLNYPINQYKEKSKILEMAINKNCPGLIETAEKNKNMQWIARDCQDYGSRIFIFYGDENSAFKKVMEKKAYKIKGIPKIVNGKIQGEISLAIIMKVFYSYDKNYALYLKELFEARTGGIINQIK